MGNYTFYQGLKLRETSSTELDRPDVYIPSPELIEAVNLAYFLQRPLLVMGEPGSGKTKLATSIAYEIWENEYRSHLYTWNIKSTEKAKDGLYRYDALKHLRDFNFDKDINVELTKDKFREKYISDGVLGEVIRAIQDGRYTKDKPPILLIDEIDKADIDFPNDLLSELENRKFEIKEGGYEETVEAKAFAPFTIITSNREKELPPAFLRRCVFFFIDFPSEKQLNEIVLKNFGVMDKSLSIAGLAAFQVLRNRMDGLFASSEKNVSTSELKDWFKVLLNESKNKKALIKKLNEAAKTLKNGEQTDLPYYQVLLKNWEAITSLLIKTGEKSKKYE